MRRLFVLASAVVANAVVAASTVHAEAVPMVIQADTVLGVQCVLSNQFKRGEQIVWRARVVDTQTGSLMGPDMLKSLMIELPNGDRFPAHFGDHPPGKPGVTFWSYGWTVPSDYPTGSFTYRIVATSKEGKTAVFEPFKVAPSQLTVVESR